MKTYKDMSPSEKRYANEVAKIPASNKKASSMRRYYVSGGDSQVGFNYHKRKKR
jgi:hypothetical protein